MSSKINRLRAERSKNDEKIAVLRARKDADAHDDCDDEQHGQNRRADDLRELVDLDADHVAYPPPVFHVLVKAYAQPEGKMPARKKRPPPGIPGKRAVCFRWS